MGNFLGKFSYTFSITIQYATVFPVKYKFWPVMLTFYFDLVPPFYFLKWNRFFSTFTPVLREWCHYFKYYYHGKCVLIYKIKDFPWWNFDTQFKCTGVLISNVTIMRSTHLINIYSFWNCLIKNLSCVAVKIVVFVDGVIEISS